jgi:opacity protein-like surface antigen
LTRNLTPWIGLEADGGIGLGRRQIQRLYGTTLSNARTSNIWLYSGNVIVNPFSSQRPIVPYLSAGLGAVTTLADENPATSGLAANATYLTVSAGGGARWFPIPHWGVRGDYRYVGIRRDAVTLPAGQQIVRSAHRVYGALVLTF